MDLPDTLLDKTKKSLPAELQQKLQDAVLGFKYWFTEPGEDAMIMWTENHQILFHTSELLAGQRYPQKIFTNSGMTGAEHAAHALPLVRGWLENRARFGFSEWHSVKYFVEDLASLVNLVDYAEDAEVAQSAAMLVDLIAFDLANNYFRGLYAPTMGRTYHSRRVTTSPGGDPLNRSAWLLLGLEELEADGNDMASAALATSERYIPPVILADIAVSARQSNVHLERSSIDVNQGEQYGLSYKAEDMSDVMYWWAMSAPAAGPVVEATKELMSQHDLDPELIFGDALFLNVLNGLAEAKGLTLSEFSDTVAYITRGVVLETINTYTYRTPQYQLSGAQDHQKGWNGLQEQIWQATLDKDAYVFTNSPGGIAVGEFTGGWKPRATFHKKVGIIQYDRDPGDPSLDGVIATMVGKKDYMHAYITRDAFDEVIQSNKWTFASKGKGYAALYSDEATTWESDNELRVSGLKNLYIVELGSELESGSFEDFQEAIRAAEVTVNPLERGYEVHYVSPSQGAVDVSWSGPMTVDGAQVDLGPYPRFDNDYCHQEFGTLETVIETQDLRLVLDFESVARTLYALER